MNDIGTNFPESKGVPQNSVSFIRQENPQYSIRCFPWTSLKIVPFVSFPLAGNDHCQFRVLLPKFLLGPSGWHACSSRVGLLHVNCLISDISPQLALPLLGVSDHGEARSHRLDVKVTACCSQTHSIKVLDRE